MPAFRRKMFRRRTTVRRAPTTRASRPTVRRRRAIPRAPRSNQQFCSISETISQQVGQDLLTNTGYTTSYVNFPNSTDYPRTNAMAKLFQQMKLAMVIYTYEPLYNVFQGTSTAAIGTSIPDFYMLMDRQGAYASVNPTIESLISGGARPRKFTKNIVVKYKPNTFGLTTNAPATYNSSTVPGSLSTDIQFNKWFQTAALNLTTLQPINIAYFGHLVYISQENATANSAPIARVTKTIVSHFRMPFYPTS